MTLRAWLAWLVSTSLEGRRLVPETLINVGPGEVMEAGLASARHPESVPFWHDGENIAFRNLGVEKALGCEEVLVHTGFPVIRLAQAFVNGLKRVYFQDSSFRVWASDEGQPPFLLGQLSGPAELEPYGSWLYAVQTGVWFWPGSGALTLDAAGGSAKHICKASQHILFADDTTLFWPHVADSRRWSLDGDLSSTARRLQFRNLESPILAVKPLGAGGIGVYTKDTCRLVDYKGAPLWFGEKKEVLDGIGAVGPNSIIPAGFKNYGLSRNGIFITDGTQFNYVDTPPFHGYLESFLDWDRSAEVFGFHNEAYQEVVWFYPHLDGTTKGLAFKYTNGGFTKYNLPILSAASRDVFDYPLFGTTDGVTLGRGRTNQSSLIRTRPLDAGDSLSTKVFQHYRFVGRFLDATVRLGISDEVNADPFYFFEGELETAIYAEQVGVFLTIELSTTSGFFEISQILVSGQPGGPLI